MAERIRIKFKDGSHHTFTHNPRPGGSYSLTKRERKPLPLGMG